MSARWDDDLERRVAQSLREATVPRAVGPGVEAGLAADRGRARRTRTIAGAVAAVLVVGLGALGVRGALVHPPAAPAPSPVPSTSETSPAPTDDTDALASGEDPVAALARALPRGRAVTVEPRVERRSSSDVRLVLPGGHAVRLPDMPSGIPATGQRVPGGQVLVVPNHAGAWEALAVGDDGRTTVLRTVGTGSWPSVTASADGRWLAVGLDATGANGTPSGASVEVTRTGAHGRAVQLPSTQPSTPAHPTPKDIPWRSLGTQVLGVADGRALVVVDWGRVEKQGTPVPRAPGGPMASDEAVSTWEETVVVSADGTIRALPQTVQPPAGGSGAGGHAATGEIIVDRGNGCLLRTTVAVVVADTVPTACSRDVADDSTTFPSPDGRHALVVPFDAATGPFVAELPSRHRLAKPDLSGLVGNQPDVWWEDATHVLLAGSLGGESTDVVRIDVSTGALERAPLPAGVTAIRW